MHVLKDHRHVLAIVDLISSAAAVPACRRRVRHVLEDATMAIGPTICRSKRADQSPGADVDVPAVP